MRPAHITSRPNHEVGEKVLGLCGEEFKVKTLWADIPDDHVICRPCVDVALAALSGADVMIGVVRRRFQAIEVYVARLGTELDENLILDDIAETDAAHRDEQVSKAADKVARKQAKQTCTCTWGKDMSIVEFGEDCPIHSREEAKAIEE